MSVVSPLHLLCLLWHDILFISTTKIFLQTSILLLFIDHENLLVMCQNSQLQRKFWFFGRSQFNIFVEKEPRCNKRTWKRGRSINIKKILSTKINSLSHSEEREPKRNDDVSCVSCCMYREKLVVRTLPM